MQTDAAFGTRPPRVHIAGRGLTPAARLVAGATLAALLALPLTTASAGDWQVKPKEFSIVNSKAEFHFDLKGYLQWDVRDYTNWDVNDPSLRFPTSEFPRRLRLGFEGEWHKLGYEVDFDLKRTPAPTTNVSTLVQAEPPEHLKNAFLDYRFRKALRLRAGNMKLPISPELLTSEGKVDFIERNMPASRLGTDRDWGGMLYGDIRKRLAYQVGVFAGDGRLNPERAGTTAAARLVVTATKGLDLGASFTQGKVKAQPESANNFDPKGLGFDGRGPSGYKFSDRHFVNGQRRRVGVDASFIRGSWSLKAEGLEGREQRIGQGSVCSQVGGGLVCDDMPDAFGRGWAVSGTWLVTGDKKSKTIKPRRPLGKGPGAIELGVRYEGLRFDDVGPDTGFAGFGPRARNVRPSGDKAFTGGVSWWPFEFFRAVGNVVVERFDDKLRAPDPARSGNYVTLVGRLQVLIP
jgi:phosphate-selective porin